ncbi:MULTISPECIES: AEC family transporter [unclassified Haloferax]|uniref:AEC family transporter n=1 Tax=Haloferax TaxID=2251 RepID=UPI0002B18334|nr:MULTISPECIES: AEC family transporter [unclassified Haloferax]ELZ61928.1 malonate transporter [Haloferax sp. ATCC BAA-646]ELZ62041.1 malonate transporter [Haloferax sp. ATCC BAA-645]ELZ70960.1 malonate transporter [Haloferax sp. ATCC BAA-644]
MTVAANLGYMLGVLCLGALAKRLGLLDSGRRDRLTFFAFAFALPALVFTSTYDQPIREVIEPTLVLGFWLVLFTMLAVGWVVHRRVSPDSVRSVAIVQSYYSNLGFLGLPLVDSTFGSLASAKAAVILGIGALTHVPLTITVLVLVNGADVSFKEEFVGVLKTPVIPALVLGLAFSGLGLGVPGVLLTGLDALSSLALPVALLSIGASLTISTESFDFRTVGAVVGSKVVLMPLLAFAVFSTFASSWSTVQAGVTMLATPTAVSSFIYANELGGDADLASMNVFATTAVSVATLFVVLQFLL